MGGGHALPADDALVVGGGRGPGAHADPNPLPHAVGLAHAGAHADPNPADPNPAAAATAAAHRSRGGLPSDGQADPEADAATAAAAHPDPYGHPNADAVADGHVPAPARRADGVPVHPG